MQVHLKVFKKLLMKLRFIFDQPQFEFQIPRSNLKSKVSPTIMIYVSSSKQISCKRKLKNSCQNWQESVYEKFCLCEDVVEY